jgi:hypothetical protein
MRKLFTITLALGLILAISNLGWAQCVTIQDGILMTSDEKLIMPGYDEFGYNYQSHLFNGRYCDYDRVLGGPSCDVDLVMKWNDAWLSNMDCDNDGKLDRHLGYTSYIGSGAWCTNHQSGKVEVNGKMRKWTYFVKIVAVPADAYKADGKWYTADDIEIGLDIWREFAVIQRVYNDPAEGAHGILYKSPLAPGFGIY